MNKYFIDKSIMAKLKMVKITMNKVNIVKLTNE